MTAHNDDNDDEIEVETPKNPESETLTPLARDMLTTVDGLADKAGVSDQQPGGLPMSPRQALGMARMPMAYKASNDPMGTLRALAVIHEETGALLDKHADQDTATLANEAIHGGE
jgi:hypothetical protein